jgi:hypothetical protein
VLVINVPWYHAFPLELCQTGGFASDLSEDRRTPYYPDLETGTSLLHAWVDNLVRLVVVDLARPVWYISARQQTARGRLTNEGDRFAVLPENRSPSYI